MKFNLVQTLVFTLCLISVQIYGIQGAELKCKTILPQIG